MKHTAGNRTLNYILALALALLCAMPEAMAQSDNPRPSLSVRRERQSASSSSKKKAAAATEKKAASTSAGKKAATTEKKAATPSSAAKTAVKSPIRPNNAKVAPAAAADTAKNGAPRRFVPRAVRQAAQRKATVSDDRAQMEFPKAAEMPKDAAWRRDIYRTLDLTKDANATLYYPLEQQGDQINLFTYMFRLILRGQLKAYEYSLTGNEKFDAKSEIKAKDLLDRYHIYYESKDGRTKVNDSDIPAADVTEYFIKESSYYDQRTATYHTQVTALCPVMKRADDFGGTDAKYPMFWVKYSDVAPYLAKLPLTGSNYNNAATMSADDYFSMNRYDGKIYKTNNLQGRVLANYCTTDSAMAKEQKKIEKQLTDFENHIWGNDSIADSLKAKKDSAAAKEEKPRRRLLSKRRSSNSDSSTVKTKKSRGANSGSGAARVSVRRQRH